MSCITFAAFGPNPIPAPISFHQHLSVKRETYLVLRSLLKDLQFDIIATKTIDTQSSRQSSNPAPTDSDFQGHIAKYNANVCSECSEVFSGLLQCF
jgi:hypothetical protein